MDNKEIKQEIKRLKGELKEVHPSVIISDVEHLRAREIEIFESNGVEFADEKVNEERNKK